MTDMSPFTYSRYLRRISAGACWQRPRRPLLISQARLNLLHWQSMTLFAFGRGNRQKAARKTGSSPSSHCYGARLVTNALVGYERIGWLPTHWLVTNALVGPDHTKTRCWQSVFPIWLPALPPKQPQLFLVPGLTSTACLPGLSPSSPRHPPPCRSHALPSNTIERVLPNLSLQLLHCTLQLSPHLPPHDIRLSKCYCLSPRQQLPATLPICLAAAMLSGAT